MSENKFSEEKQMARCESMCKFQSVISGKWKILIIWYISFYKMQRFNELQRRLDGITHSTLANQLKELEGLERGKSDVAIFLLSILHNTCDKAPQEIRFYQFEIRAFDKRRSLSYFLEKPI